MAGDDAKTSAGAPGGQGTDSKAGDPRTNPTGTGPTPPGKEPPTGKGTGDGSIGMVQRAGLGAAGIWLVGLIAGAVFTAAIIFSATQFQARLASLTLYGGPLSAWKADQLRAEWAGSLQVLDAAKKALNDTQERLAATFEQRSELEQRKSEAVVAVQQIRNKLQATVVRYDQALANSLKQMSTQDFIEAVAAKPEIRDKDKSIDKDIDELKPVDAQWIEVLAQIDAREAEIKSLSDDIEKAKQKVDAAKKNAQLTIPPRNGIEVPPEQLFQIENAIYESQTMFAHYYLVYNIVLAPSDILVLLLVLAMGVLGSAMQLSYIYLTEFSRRSFAFYMFRPFLGAIMAFGVFIVTKAGIPLVTDVTRSGGAATVNPYFISFLGIISGLLSERALDWVRRLGANYFRDTEGEEPQRWAREDLNAKFAAINRNPKLIQTLLKAKGAEFKRWLDGSDPVPPPAQNVLSAALGVARRDLFTDIPPTEGDGES